MWGMVPSQAACFPVQGMQRGVLGWGRGEETHCAGVCSGSAEVLACIANRITMSRVSNAKLAHKDSACKAGLHATGLHWEGSRAPAFL